MTRLSSLAVAVALIAAVAAVSLAVVAFARSDSSSDHDMADSGMNMMHGSSTGGDSMDMGGADDMGGHGSPAPQTGVPDATETSGGQPLAHAVDGDTWVFELTAQPVKWEILPGTRVTAWSYNGTVPGPEIRVPYGQKVKVLLKNELPEPTTVHWHGIAVPNAMDGVPDVTQKPIAPGETFTYSFRAVPAGGGTGGTFMYHSHYDEDRQVGLGMSAPFVIVPPEEPEAYAVERTLMLGEWNLDAATGDTRPPMQMEGSFPNYFTINGKSFPATDPINVRPGQRVLLRLVGAGQFNHPMHLHGTSFTVVAKDGHELESSYEADVVDVAPGERYDVAFTAEAGTWVLHCHIGHHLTNGGVSPGGLVMTVNVSDAAVDDALTPTASAQTQPDSTAVTGMEMSGMDMGGTSGMGMPSGTQGEGG